MHLLSSSSNTQKFALLEDSKVRNYNDLSHSVQAGAWAAGCRPEVSGAPIPPAAHLGAHRHPPSPANHGCSVTLGMDSGSQVSCSIELLWRTK